MLRIPALHWVLLLAVIAVGLAVRSRISLPRADAQILSAPVVPQPAMPAVIRPSQSGNGATARRDRNGNFIFDARVNGMPLQMVFDTGASVTSLRAEDAARVGIDTGSLNYSATVSTANGHTSVAPVMIETLTVGDITRHYVTAVVARPGVLGMNLLGQSFMAKIGGYRVVGQDLVLQGEP
ncbi:TIGR02281 family clan AA aspartic protease [Acidisphaera sp. L21]|uniref:retropepsin-like aspartic protease family protein n=1 Tax=Acidisphaera sp. L21 TaxID=1641851 RepID=UPI00131C17DF|nr:TIGR02281 family clan AA aspartic protease [Acidisphaera sp. L21]